MPSKKTTACVGCMALLMMSVNGCASKSESPAQTQQCPPPQAPAAWAMQPASNSVQQLDALFGISEK